MIVYETFTIVNDLLDTLFTRALHKADEQFMIGKPPSSLKQVILLKKFTFAQAAQLMMVPDIFFLHEAFTSERVSTSTNT